MAKILIVEDEALVVRMYQKALEFDGFEVINALGGEEGVKLAKSGKPDLILMDIMMPEMSGVDALDNLKKDPETNAIPVVMLTNMSGEQDKQLCLQKGAIDYIVKSQYTPKKLSAYLKSSLENKPGSTTQT